MTSEPPTTVPGRARQCPCAGGRGLEWKVYGNICVAREEGARRYIWLSWSWARHARQSGPVGGEGGGDPPRLACATTVGLAGGAGEVKGEAATRGSLGGPCVALRECTVICSGQLHGPINSPSYRLGRD